MDDTPNLNELANRWLAQLEKAGLPEPSEEPEDTVRLRLLDGRVVYFRLRPEDWQYSYKGARRNPGSERMERAILAALVALEVSPVDPRRKASKGSRVIRQGAHLRVGVQEAMRAGADESEAMQQAIENDSVLKDAGTDASQAEARLSFAEALLKHYYPGFDDQPKGERIDLLMQAARHVDEALRGLEALQDFVHASRLGGRAKKKAADPERDVRAAELKDALGLTQTKIGEILSVPLSQKDKDEGGHRGVANMVQRGRKLLIDNLGEEEYEEHIATIKSDLQRWYSSRYTREGLIERLLEISAALKGRTLEESEAMRPDFEQLVDKHIPEE